jgi:hypothetical protein
MEAISAVSSPQTNAPAPSLTKMSKLKPEPRMLLAEQVGTPGGFERNLEAADRQRILCAAVDVAGLRTNCVAGDRSCLR